MVLLRHHSNGKRIVHAASGGLLFGAQHGGVCCQRVQEVAVGGALGEQDVDDGGLSETIGIGILEAIGKSSKAQRNTTMHNSTQ